MNRVYIGSVFLCFRVNPTVFKKLSNSLLNTVFLNISQKILRLYAFLHFQKNSAVCWEFWLFFIIILFVIIK